MGENDLSLEQSIWNDRIVHGVIKQFETQIWEFMVHNYNAIIKQVDEDKDYNSGEADCPTVPLFDQYLIGLEEKIRKYVLANNYSESIVTKTVFTCRGSFYRSALPAILESSDNR